MEITRSTGGLGSETTDSTLRFLQSLEGFLGERVLILIRMQLKCKFSKVLLALITHHLSQPGNNKLHRGIHKLVHEEDLLLTHNAARLGPQELHCLLSRFLVDFFLHRLVITHPTPSIRHTPITRG